jgi:hypothetical protein
MTNVDVDLIAYLALRDAAALTEDAAISEDIASKMVVHSKRISKSNPNITLRI